MSLWVTQVLHSDRANLRTRRSLHTPCALQDTVHGSARTRWRTLRHRPPNPRFHRISSVNPPASQNRFGRLQSASADSWQPAPPYAARKKWSGQTKSRPKWVCSFLVRKPKIRFWAASLVSAACARP